MTRRIEITEALLRDGVTDYHAGDVLTLPKDKADLWVSYGWAKDAATGETGERIPGARAVDVANVTQTLG